MPEVQISRRTALLGGAASTLLLPSLLRGEEEQETEANRFVRNFPEAEDLPEIARVERVIVPGASKVLVHLRQIHDDYDLPEELVALVEQCQLEIYHLLQFLQRDTRYALQSVLNESTVIGEEEGYLRERMRHARANMEALLTNSAPTFFIIRDESISRALGNEKLLRRRVEGMSTLGSIGAAEILAFQEKFGLIGVERKDWQRKLDEFHETGRTDPELQFDSREKLQLSIAAERKELAIYTIMGANHDFREEITEHNAIPGNVRFAHLRITPKSVKEYDEKYPLSPQQ